MIGVLFTDAGKPIFIGPGNLGPVGLGSFMHACKTSKLLEHGQKNESKGQATWKNQSCQSSPSSEQTAMQYDLLCVLPSNTTSSTVSSIFSSLCSQQPG